MSEGCFCRLAVFHSRKMVRIIVQGKASFFSEMQSKIKGEA